jgi:hypothetical protein
VTREGHSIRRNVTYFIAKTSSWPIFHKISDDTVHNYFSSWNDPNITHTKNHTWSYSGALKYFWDWGVSENFHSFDLIEVQRLSLLFFIFNHIQQFHILYILLSIACALFPLYTQRRTLRRTMIKSVNKPLQRKRFSRLWSIYTCHLSHFLKCIY